ncbi:MAG: hypothetical protein O6929_04010 [candidate division NC10 bacterium]|nr:hypothetical protein [candidate division NC10 bacterium]
MGLKEARPYVVLLQRTDMGDAGDLLALMGQVERSTHSGEFPVDRRVTRPFSVSLRDVAVHQGGGDLDGPQVAKEGPYVLEGSLETTQRTPSVDLVLGDEVVQQRAYPHPTLPGANELPLLHLCQSPS